ncbi:hypothetical protein LPB67_15445 [Undibacterium sp. Jales W-56]|uniref:hypothetical protein n=1 Tax=Undibacterium sp. Jales W-56 TaxID=2897325 RepID=UPI0021D28BE2|nr:hypothetical protein [Undibacterium sp. Jales W-56]MCU6435171.1 hypothetical protein [Undibacterium sp. Jales W-56]
MDDSIDMGDRDAGDDDASEVARPVINLWHESFAPACAPVTLDCTPPSKAHVLLAEIKKTIKAEPQQRGMKASAWAVTPRGARRTVLSAAGLNPDEWERPIDSFSDSERAALSAAARAAVRVYERVCNAI